jgi:hypothetical protein
MSSLSQTIEQNSVRKIPADLMGLVSTKGDRSNTPEIHRIKTAAAFRKLGGGEDLPVDFNVRDLVIVYGSLGCSRGNVMFSLHDSTVLFRIDIVQHCTHMTRQLCLIPYTASYGLLKDLVIAPTVNIGKHHSLVRVKQHTGIPSPGETTKSNLIRQLHNLDESLTELVLDHTEGDAVRYGVEDICEITLALNNHGSLSSSPLERVVITEEFSFRSLNWRGDWKCLEKLVPKLWKVAAQLPCVIDLRFHCPSGQLVNVPMLQYLRDISNPENLRRLELNVGGDLMKYMVSGYRFNEGWVLSPRVEQELKEFVGTIGRAVNLKVLQLRWRHTNEAATEKVQGTMSTLTSTLSRLEHLTSLHLE